MKRFKRILRKIFEKRDQSRRLDLNSLLTLVTALCVIIFIGTQLITNALLSPLGHKLQSLNSEKNLIIEQNRELEQEIAKNTSLIILQTYTKNKFNLTETTPDETIFVGDFRIEASNINDTQ